MKITIRDVARECKVSPFTVSSVINNKRAVKEETKQMVRAAIRKLGYDPSLNVPHARTVKTDTLGLLIPKQGTGHLPFYQRAVTAFTNECAIAGFRSNPMTIDDISARIAAGKDGFNNLMDCAGFVVYCPIQNNWQDLIKRIGARGTPQVLIRRRFTGEGIINITNDDEVGIRKGLEHLHAQGHTRIALVAMNPDHWHNRRHTPTYRTFLEERNMPFDERLVTGLSVNRKEYFGTWWDGLPPADRPTALLCHDDWVAYKVVYQLQQRGVRIPQDVSVMGFDDDYGSNGIGLPLTSLRVPVEEMIGVGIRMLVDMVRGVKMDNAVINMPIELKIRNSTGTARRADSDDA